MLPVLGFFLMLVGAGIFVMGLLIGNPSDTKSYKDGDLRIVRDNDGYYLERYQSFPGWFPMISKRYTLMEAEQLIKAIQIPIIDRKEVVKYYDRDQKE